MCVLLYAGHQGTCMLLFVLHLKVVMPLLGWALKIEEIHLTSTLHSRTTSSKSPGWWGGGGGGGGGGGRELQDITEYN